MVALKRAFGVLKSSMNRSKCERTYPIDGWKSFEVTDKQRKMAANNNKI